MDHISKYKTKVSFVITAMVISSMIAYMVFNFAFMHFHIVDGKVIVHSHYTASNNQSSQQSSRTTHTHSNKEFLHYYLTSILDKFVISHPGVFILASLITILSFISVSCLIHPAIYGCLLNRAPPVSLFSLAAQ